MSQLKLSVGYKSRATVASYLIAAFKRTINNNKGRHE